jgi:hypothetical protein
MIVALDYLAQMGDRVLVRMYSQWWIRESEMLGSLRPVAREAIDLNDREHFAGMNFVDSPPVVVITTSTVKAMAARGILKMVGGKRVLSGSAKKDYWRAELTVRGTTLRLEIEDRAQNTYEELIARVGDEAAPK